MKRLKFLGHVIDETGISIDTSRAQAIFTHKQPKTASEIRSFLGMASCFRKFIDNYADLSAPLLELTKKNRKFKWETEQENAFQKLKQVLSQAPVLAFPNYSLPFEIETKSSAQSCIKHMTDSLDRFHLCQRN